MDVEILAVCDAATSAGNKINLVGVFDEVHGPTAPLGVTLGIAGRVRFDPPDELGRRQIELRISHPDGGGLFSAHSEVDVTRKPDGGGAIQFAFQLPPLMLPWFGRYTLD